MVLKDTPYSIDFSDAKCNYNLSRRVANTGASSPFVLLALAAMRSYSHNGISATVNLRQDDRASIIMVSPPAAAEKANNKSNSYSGGSEIDSSQLYDPFIEKRMR
ncbi:DUF2875 family protein [Chromobacterium phragmitis]|uniref:Type VI lipase adapter protein Tla3 C-terminal domain-containing protein n=1 Tax=Chromobacterium phragmitis TaxID=2202141 RepID=A0A344UEM8_9NEIS|nr:hypothetical protein DK843_04970 [Chromobacterium phragmitis]